MRVHALILPAISLLGACSGGGSEVGYCVGSFEGGSTDFACTTCSGVDPFDEDSLAPVIDNRGDTYRLVGLDPNGSITLRIRAPVGMTFPADVDAGAKLRFPAGVSITAAYSLYQGTTPVAATSGGAISSGGSPQGAGGDGYYAVVPSDTIDRIDLSLNVSGNGERANFRVYEFCGDR